MQTVNRLQLATLHYNCGHDLRIMVPYGTDAEQRRIAAVCVCPACRVRGAIKKGKEDDDTRQQPLHGSKRYEQATLF